MNELLNEIECCEVMDRDNLGVVALVEALEAIPNKDNIELVKLKNLGYTCVCQKGHSVGDLVLFVKYDSIVPAIPLFDFMADTKYRVKAKGFTVRDEDDCVVDKIYSQGIVVPVSTIIETYSELFWLDCIEGTDVTQELGIKKYIAPVKGSGSNFGNMQSKGDFPTHLCSKTDEMNLASKMRALEEIKGQRVYITLKIEGSSLTCGYDDNNEFFVASRNNMLKENENKFWQAVRKNNIDVKLAQIPNNLILQNELFGEGIQKNKLGIVGVDMMCFNMIETATRRLLPYDEMVRVATFCDIPLVPVVCIIENFDWDFDKLQKYADIQKYPNGELAEGIVVRCCTPMYSKVLKTNWSVKVISREYKF